MKKSILTSLFSTIALVLILVMPTMAHGWKLAVDIPFDFTVGETTLSSGRYIVQMYSGGYISVRSEEDRKSAVSLTNAMLTRRGQDRGKLLFNAYGDRYFLSSVSMPYGPSRMLAPANVETEAARNLEARRKLEIASQ